MSWLSAFYFGSGERRFVAIPVSIIPHNPDPDVIAEIDPPPMVDVVISTPIIYAQVIRSEAAANVNNPKI